MNNEILVVPVLEYVWWDKETEQQVRWAITGTPENPHPYTYLQQRRIQIGFKHIHNDCGGEIKKKWSTRWEGTISYTTVWDECSICGKKFNVEEF